MPRLPTRDETASYWLDKYREPIDCEELERIASVQSVERARLQLLGGRLSAEFASFLEDLAERPMEFLHRRRSGSSRTAMDEIEAFARAREEASGPGVTIEDFPILAVAAGLTKELREASRRLRARAEAIPPELRQVRVKEADLAFGGACLAVSEWIRERHQSKRGELDGRTSWPDVIRCLKWHGNDLRHLAGDPPAAARRAAARWSRVRGGLEEFRVMVSE